MYHSHRFSWHIKSNISCSVLNEVYKRASTKKFDPGSTLWFGLWNFNTAGPWGWIQSLLQKDSVSFFKYCIQDSVSAEKLAYGKSLDPIITYSSKSIYLSHGNKPGQKIPISDKWWKINIQYIPPNHCYYQIEHNLSFVYLSLIYCQVIGYNSIVCWNIPISKLPEGQSYISTSIQRNV